MKQHDTERREDRTDRKAVEDLRSIDSNVIKWMGVALTAILGFLAITVFNDHSTLIGISQWETDHGTEIDQDHASIGNINDIIQSRWKNQTTSMADTTNQ